MSGDCVTYLYWIVLVYWIGGVYYHP